MAGCSDELCCPARAWLVLLALGSWALLCVLDLSAARWSEQVEDSEEDYFRWLSHGVSLAVLAVAAIALLAAGLWPRMGSETAKVATPCSGVVVHRLVPVEAQRCFALALHGTLVACALGWVALQLVAGRQPQVWIGLSTLYTLVSLAVAHRVMRPPTSPGLGWVDGVVTSSPMSGSPNHKQKGDALEDSFSDGADASPVVAVKTCHSGYTGSSSPFLLGDECIGKHGGSSGSSPRVAGDGLPDSYSVRVNITSNARLDRWRPLFKDATFGGSLPSRTPLGGSRDDILAGTLLTTQVDPSGFVGGVAANDFCFAAPTRPVDPPPPEEVQPPIDAAEAARKASLRLSLQSRPDIPGAAEVSRQSSESGLSDGSESQGASNVGPLGNNEEETTTCPAAEPSEAETRLLGEASQEKESAASSATFEPSARFESHSSCALEDHSLNRVPNQEPHALEQ